MLYIIQIKTTSLQWMSEKEEFIFTDYVRSFALEDFVLDGTKYIISDDYEVVEEILCTIGCFAEINCDEKTIGNTTIYTDIAL